jgi:hypothetical protein
MLPRLAAARLHTLLALAARAAVLKSQHLSHPRAPPLAHALPTGVASLFALASNTNKLPCPALLRPALPCSQVAGQLRSGGRLDIPACDEAPGPPLPTYDAYVTLMQRCWAEDPGQRPCFAEVIVELRCE